MSSPALSDGKFVCNQNQSWPTKACNNQGREYHTPAFYQSSSQPCGDRELRSKFCQAAASSALELAPINSFSVPPILSQTCDNDYITPQSTEFFFGSAGCGESGHGRPTKENAKCWSNSDYRTWVGIPSQIDPRAIRVPNF